MDAMHLTRRRLLELGAGALGASALAPLEPALALAGPRATSRSLRLPYARRIGPLAVPGGFELAGLRWPGGGHVHALVRARGRGGRWTDWVPMGLSLIHI